MKMQDEQDEIREAASRGEGMQCHSFIQSRPNILNTTVIFAFCERRFHSPHFLYLELSLLVVEYPLLQAMESHS